jgi:post-segregation antitoxin (ccd killing protein)
MTEKDTEKEVKRTATSLNVDEDLWRQAKIEAINRGTTVTELFEDALRRELRRPRGP